MFKKFVVFLSIVCVVLSAGQTAQINISGRIYVHSGVYGNPWRWHQSQQPGTEVLLTAQELHDHFVNIKNGNAQDAAGMALRPADILRELARILLAQIPGNGGAPGPHNVPGNGTPGYVIAPGGNNNDIHLACGRLKKHMLEHGHLGYFPGLSFVPENSPSVVNQLSARGIFNIPYGVANRITNRQKSMLLGFLNNPHNYFPLPGTPTYPAGYNVTADTFHLLPNLASQIRFGIDPAPNGAPNLEDIANGLIDNLLSTDQISTGGNNINIEGVNGNRFNITVLYVNNNNFITGLNVINHTPGPQYIGYDRDTRGTNKLRIVVQVDNGIVSIVTMFPW